MGDNMRLSDLQNKEIVSTESGRNIGSIMDIEIDITTGNIISLLLEQRKGFRFLTKSSEFDNKIEWKNIIKIGEDVILVKK